MRTEGLAEQESRHGEEDDPLERHQWRSHGMSASVLRHAESILNKYTPADFDKAGNFAAVECFDAVRGVKDERAWTFRYPSLETFYVMHELRHPDVRYYAAADRELRSDDPLTGRYEMPSQRLARLRQAES